MERRKISRIDKALYIAVFILIVYLFVVVYYMTDTERDPGTRALYAWATVCQRIAATFGQWGLHAEIAYRTALENSRMI